MAEFLSGILLGYLTESIIGHFGVLNGPSAPTGDSAPNPDRDQKRLQSRFFVAGESTLRSLKIGQMDDIKY